MKFLLLPLFLSAIVFATPQHGQKVLKLKKTTEQINVDGIIEPIWNAADSVSDFVQLQPYQGKDPSRKTVAKVLTTESSLYCIIICYEDPRNIQRNTGKLDDFNGDVVSLMLDTFGDKQTAYKFAVTASGVKSDSRLLDDARNRDYSWDGIWFSDTKVYNWGFVVEMEIPYKSIQYDETLSQWGLDFDRWIPVANEDIYWCAYEANEGQRISKFGTLVFEDFRPSVKGLNLEVYPVGISKATYLRQDTYDFDPHAGVDIFYNPSPKLTFQFTANPDFAQIEADPFEFNISRYETYYDERRPFFTQGNEIFMASGRQRNSGFYRPLELFYSRRIGKKLVDGSEVPLAYGAKAFGRIGEWEYGGFVARTAEREYMLNDEHVTEPWAYFTSARFKKQILENSSIGVLFVGKHADGNNDGVIDIDGAFRGSTWQLSYQLARSFQNSVGDFGGSAGLVMFSEKWITLARGRYVGERFDVNQVGFVPWKGTWQTLGITGPRWYFEEGAVREMLLYVGPWLNHEDADAFTDYAALLGFNMQFRRNWGFEINLSGGRSKDSDKKFNSYELSLSSWYNISPKWNANLYGGYSKTYNFSRDYLAFYSWMGSYFSWRAADMLEVGTSASLFVEGNPEGRVEDVTMNARPFFSLTPINNLNVRVYVDNLYVKSSKRLERVIGGLLFAYNFLPKSWIYLAINEVRDRSDEYDSTGALLPHRMHVADRAGVLKVKYLYYF